MTRAATAFIAVLVISGGRAFAVELPEWVGDQAVNAALEEFPRADAVQLLRSCGVEVNEDGVRKVVKREAFYVRQGTAGGHARACFVESRGTKLQKMRAWKRNKDGRVHSLEDPVTTQFLGGELYSDARELWILVEGTAPGTILATEICYEDRSPSFRTDYWEARTDLPVWKWEYSLRLPRGWSAQGEWFDADDGTAMARAPDSIADGYWFWTRTKIPVPIEKEEPFALSDAKTAPVFLVRYGPEQEPEAARWESVSDWYRDLSAAAFAGDEALEPIALSLTEGREPVEAKLRSVGEFVRGSIGYVQIYVEDGGWRPHAAKDVYSNRYGDCKDMSHLAIALLRLGGIAAYPVLTNLEHGHRIWSDFPMPSFDHCIVGVENPQGDGKWLFFDPTAKSIPVGRLDYRLQGAAALIVGATCDTALIDLPAGSPIENCRRVQVEVDLQPGMIATLRVCEQMTGQAAYTARAALSPLTDQQRWDLLQRTFQDRHARSRLVNLSFPDLGTVGDTLVMRYELQIAAAARAVGNLVLIQPDFVSIHTHRLFPRERRLRGIVFDYPTRTDTEVELRFPMEWRVKEVPTEVSAENSFGSFARAYDAGPGTLHVRRVEEILRNHVPASDYWMVREWDSACYEADRQRVVLEMP